MRSPDPPFSTQFEVVVDAVRAREYLAVMGMPDAPALPASYALLWLSSPPIKEWLLNRTPPGSLPVFTRQMFSSFELLQLHRRYQVAATMSDLPQKKPAARISYLVRRNEAKVLQGEIDIVFLSCADIARL